MAELADALDLGSSAREGVGVQVSPGARRISEMRTRFSDLVFPIGEIQRPVALFAVSAHLPVLALVLHPGATILPPAPTPPTPHTRAASRPVYPPCVGPASRRPSEPLFHHAVSKRPDYQLYTIMRPRLCHSGGQVSLHRRWL